MKINLLAFVITIFFTNALFSQTESCLQNKNHPGYNQLSQVVGPDTILREYILQTPENYNPDNKIPLIFVLHGFGDCAADFYKSVGESFNLNGLANEERFITVYPQAAYRDDKEDNYWEPGDNGNMNIANNDIYFFEQLITQMSSEYNIDENSIYAIGYSNGGMMTYSLACNKSTLFSAVGIMSGTMLEEDCILENTVPMIVFHGIEDAVLPYEGNIYYRSVSEIVNFWLTLNDILPNSLISTELNNGKVIKDEYHNGQSSCLTLYTVYEEWDKPGGHVWFSDEIDGQNPNQIIWDFFSKSCVVLDTESITNEKSLTLAPNPFSKNITIFSSQENNQDYKLYDLNGNIIKSGITQTIPFTIELEDIPANIYLLHISGQVHKIVKID